MRRVKISSGVWFDPAHHRSATSKLYRGPEGVFELTKGRLVNIIY